MALLRDAPPVARPSVSAQPGRCEHDLGFCPPHLHPAHRHPVFDASVPIRHAI